MAVRGGRGRVRGRSAVCRNQTELPLLPLGPAALTQCVGSGRRGTLWARYEAARVGAAPGAPRGDTLPVSDGFMCATRPRAGPTRGAGCLKVSVRHQKGPPRAHRWPRRASS